MRPRPPRNLASPSLSQRPGWWYQTCGLVRTGPEPGGQRPTGCDALDPPRRFRPRVTAPHGVRRTKLEARGMAVWVEYDRRARNGGASVERPTGTYELRKQPGQPTAIAIPGPPFAPKSRVDPSLWNDALLAQSEAAPKARRLAAMILLVLPTRSSSRSMEPPEPAP